MTMNDDARIKNVVEHTAARISTAFDKIRWWPIFPKASRLSWL